MSIAERKLWFELRDRRMNDLKFRRQHPIGRFIADFACVELRLIVEVDGESHDLTADDDAARTELLKSMRFDVVRFKTEDVLFRFEGVLQKLNDVCVSRATTRSP